MKVNQVIKMAKELLEGKKPSGQIELSLQVYIDRIELSVSFEAPYCLYLAGYEIDDCSQIDAEFAYDALRDNTVLRGESFNDYVCVGKEMMEGDENDE